MDPVREEFLEPKGMTQGELARKMGVPLQRVNLICNDRRAVTAEAALLLARALGTSPEFWMQLQMNYDLWIARRELARSASR